ncbi:MAG TPA: GNAT family N-acetyltransferase [Anaerolineaceae bacterium]|nr:GNAT family N-acetyltransferase [Anaerolineaceae bacterium]
MTIEIKEVQTRNDLKRFSYFVRSLYKGNPYWVPPIYKNVINTFDPARNAAYEYSQSRQWLALKDGKIVGRVAAILSEGHRQRWNQAYMRFGWLDFIDDEAVSKALLDTVEDWAHEKGCTAIHGPLGFTDMDQAGMLVEGFNEMGTMATIYNHAYYPMHMENLGYTKDTDWIEFELRVPAQPDPKIAHLASIILRRENLRLVTFTKKSEILPYAKRIFALFNESYRNLYGYVPLNDRQVEEYTKQYFGFIQPEFLPVVEDAAGDIVAFGITMPSLARALQRAGGELFPFGFLHLLRANKVNDRADLYLIAVKPEYQGKGVNAVLIDTISRVFIKNGIQIVESNPELETNHLVQGQWKHFESRQHKRRRCYIKHLQATPEEIPSAT